MSFVRTDCKIEVLNPIQGEGGVFDADVVSVIYETDPAVLE